jgi:hypothetical protein
MYDKPFPFIVYPQALLVALSSLMVYLSTTHRTENQELHAFHQLINWSVAGIVLTLHSSPFLKFFNPMLYHTDLLAPHIR